MRYVSAVSLIHLLCCTSCATTIVCTEVAGGVDYVTVEDLTCLIQEALSETRYHCVVVRWPAVVRDGGGGYRLSPDDIVMAVARSAEAAGFVGFSDRWMLNEPRALRFHRGPPYTVMTITGASHPMPIDWLKRTAEQCLMREGIPFAWGESMSATLDVPMYYSDEALRVLARYDIVALYLMSSK